MVGFRKPWEVNISPFAKYKSDNLLRTVARWGGSYRDAKGYLEAHERVTGQKVTYGHTLQQKTFSMFQQNEAKRGLLAGKPLDYVPGEGDIMIGRHWQPEPYKTTVKSIFRDPKTGATEERYRIFYSEDRRSLGDMMGAASDRAYPWEVPTGYELDSMEIDRIEARSNI